MSDATPLDQLMPTGGSQQSAMSLPASTTYPQMITPGTSNAIVSPPHPGQGGGQMNPYMIKNVLKNIICCARSAPFVLSKTNLLAANAACLAQA